MSVNKIEVTKENTRELNLLVVEDNDLFHAMYEEMLDGYFKSYTKAMNGLEGLELFKEKPDFYDIVIADHQMPKMGGIEMISAMKEIRSDVSIVFVTGTSNINIISVISLLSIDASLMKPLKQLELLSVLDNVSTTLLEKRHMQDRINELEAINQAHNELKDTLLKELERLNPLARAQILKKDLVNLITAPISLPTLEAKEDGADVEETEADIVVEDIANDDKSEESESTIPHNENIEEPEGRFKDIRYTVVDKISAEEFVAEIDDGTFAELDDFREDLENFNMILNEMSTCDPSLFHGYLHQVAEFYHRLYKTVNSLVVFVAIENTFKEFAHFIENIEQEQLEDSDKQNLLVDALFALSDDLSKWINIIFYDKNTDNIHYFDASFANTCLEIEAMFNAQEAEAVEDDEELLEFF